MLCTLQAKQRVLSEASAAASRVSRHTHGVRSGIKRITGGSKKNVGSGRIFVSGKQWTEISGNRAGALPGEKDPKAHEHSLSGKASAKAAHKPYSMEVMHHVDV